jgi:ABC-2 type transport system ATP-binding protein
VLTDLAEQAGTTILVTTHYLEEADQYASKIAIVDQGASWRRARPAS